MDRGRHFLLSYTASLTASCTASLLLLVAVLRGSVLNPRLLKKIKMGFFLSGRISFLLYLMF